MMRYKKVSRSRGGSEVASASQPPKGSSWPAGMSDAVISDSASDPTYMTIDIQPMRNRKKSRPPRNRTR